MEQIERVDLRDAELADFPETEKIYKEWFPSDLSVDDEEYRVLLARGGYSRIAETVSATGKRIVGFYSLWPLSEKTFNDLRDGIIKEKDFTSRMILPFNDAQAACLYVSEIGVLRDGNFGTILLRDALSYVVHLLKRHPQFQTIAAWAYSPKGKAIAERLGMERVVSGELDRGDYYAASKESALARLRHLAPFASRRSIVCQSLT